MVKVLFLYYHSDNRCLNKQSNFKHTHEAFVILTHVEKRNGTTVPYDRDRILRAIQQAFQADNNDVQLAEVMTSIVEERLSEAHNTTLHVEFIQDTVETILMQQHPPVAKLFILYRNERKRLREQQQETAQRSQKITVIESDTEKSTYSQSRLRSSLQRISEDLKNISLDPIVQDLERSLFNNIRTKDILKTLILSAASYIERDPAYNMLASRMFCKKIVQEVLNPKETQLSFASQYKEAFIKGIQLGLDQGIFDKNLDDYDLSALGEYLQPDRDDLLRYTGISTLYDRYLIRHAGQCIEMPQSFWMRVAMGIALNEKPEDRHSWTLAFYDTISTLHFIPSTPTLFHSGLSCPQLSSCYLTTINDDLRHIFKCIGDNAQMSKWSGGIGNDWTPVRATGAFIKSTRVASQGVVPFLKIANDTTVAINRSGKRRGATCAYLETWHLDIEDFLDLKRNTGDERRRTHDMNTANWIPDLFVKRVINQESWTLFSPNEVPDLHDLYGHAFEERYCAYEAMAERGEITQFRKIDAIKLWRKMITRLFETGHPWFTFKDPCNIRSPQDHVGVIHSSNLCTEITLNTSADETAVCNLGSINLARHCSKDGINQYSLSQTIEVAVRMLDNVININFYPTIEAKNSNMRHRPIGLGLMGLQDFFFMTKLPMGSEQALQVNDSLMEFISYHAILASSRLAEERGRYESFAGSKWDRGILPIDTLALLEKERREPIEIDMSSNLDWDYVRQCVQKKGMRNSNVMAIAPTATISNIAGCFPCIEPIYKNIYVKSNMSGEFVVINAFLVEDLKERGLWNNEMLDQLKYYDGKISQIPNIPQELRELYADVFDTDPVHLIKMTALRAKWIDQSQSHNLFVNSVSGALLDKIYKAAWRCGLKTTYYLRTLGASQIEKSTLNAKKYGYTQKRVYQDQPLSPSTPPSSHSPLSPSPSDKR